MELDVLLNGELAGTLSYTAETHRHAFLYCPAWLSRKDRYALGPTLPLELAEVAHGAEAAVQEQHSAAVRQFFENLLPEGQALDDAASTHRLSKGNLMGLLAALGGETAGALQLRRPGTGVAPVAEIRRALAHTELSERIRARPFHPFSVWDGRVRLSIAGYQDKIAVFEEEGQWSLVEGSHLASFEWAHFTHACALPFRQVSTELSRMARRVHEALPKACEDARVAGVEPARISQLHTLVAAECERQAEMAPAVAKADPALY